MSKNDKHVGLIIFFNYSTIPMHCNGPIYMGTFCAHNIQPVIFLTIHSSLLFLFCFLTNHLIFLSGFLENGVVIRAT